MVKALREKRFTLDELVNLDNEANEVGMPPECYKYLSPNLVHALIKKQITLSSFITIYNTAHDLGMSDSAKAYLNTLECVKAITKGIYTVEIIARLFAQADEVGMSGELKWNLIKPSFVLALEHHEFTVASMAQTEREAIYEELGPSIRAVLLVRPECFKALYKNLFTVSDLAQQSPNFINAFFHHNCLKALESGDVDIDQMMALSLVELDNANVSGEYPNKALRLGR
jgi:hypothetical protein